MLQQNMNKITIYLKPAKGFEDILKKIGLEATIENIVETLRAHGWEFKIVEDDKFEVESKNWEGGK